MNLSYGLNIEDIIRFEVFYDQALVNDRVSGYHNTYFSGVGLSRRSTAPGTNSLIRGEIGCPSSSHGDSGVHRLRSRSSSSSERLASAAAARRPALYSSAMPEPIPFPTSVTPVRRALVSVHDKTGIAELARELAAPRRARSSRPAARPRT